MGMQISRFPVIRNRVIAPGYFLMEIESPEISGEARPGQFVMIRTGNGLKPLLRRPLSLHRVSPPSIELLYQAIGPGTRSLSRIRPGEFLDILGPLGKPIPLPRPGTGAILLVAGGIGVAPLLALAEKISKSSKFKVQGSRLNPKNKQTNKNKITLLYGAKSKAHLVKISDFQKLGIEVETVTEDGRQDRRGLATDLLRKSLASLPGPVSTVYACGPRPMLKAVAEILRTGNFPVYLSLEEMMACGMGACLGCSVPARVAETKYLRVCQDGPVFESGEIVL